MLVGRTGLSPVMVGRSGSLQQLLALLERPSAAVAVIGGEAGIGKSRLVRELLDQVPDGHVVLAGQADPSSLGRPFDLLFDALSDHLPQGDTRLDELRHPDGERRALTERLDLAREVLIDVIAGRPAVVVFDDLHWADAESVALFEQLAAREVGLAMLVGTYRPEEVTRRHPLAEAIPHLERRQAVLHLRIQRLDTEGVADFLAAVYGGVPSDRTIESLHARTGGNPFFLEELLLSAGGNDVDRLSTLPLPWNLAELIRGQVNDLPAPERHVIETAAVLGRRVTFDLLAEVSGCSEKELIEVLRSLIEHGLLTETDPDVFGFRHDLSREAIVDRLLGRERRRLHEAALEALRRVDSPDLAAMAHHAHGAGRFEELVDLAKRGSDHYLARGSTYQALGLAELGLSEADDDLDLRQLAAWSAWLCGLIDDAVDHARRLEATATRAGDLEHRSAALRLLVRLYWERDDHAERADAVAALVAGLDDLGDTPERARVLAGLAQEAMLDARGEEALAWSGQALEAAERHGLVDVRISALVEEGSARLHRGETGPALDQLLRVAEEATSLGEDVAAARALHNAAFMSHSRFDERTRTVLFDRMRVAAAKAGIDQLSGAAYFEGRSAVATMVGDIAEAQRWLEESRRTGRGSRRQATVGCALDEVWLHLERGELDVVEVELEELGQLSDEMAPAALALRATLAAVRGRPGVARALLTEMERAAEIGGLDVADVEPLIPRVFDHGLTARDLRPVVARASRFWGAANEGLDVWKDRFEAHLMLSEGSAEEAVERFERLLSRPGAAEFLAAPELAVDHLGAARGLLLLRRSAEAAVHADAAALLLSRWEGWRVDVLSTVERRLGRGSGSEVGGPPELTPREREVLALVAEGLTNAELADRLYISPRTAGVHVSNILAKLGLSSRTEAAAWAIRSGLAV